MAMHESLTVHRIVDGEYQPEELRAWVTQADASPERWRELALAFLENHAWSASFRAQAAENEGPRAGGLAAALSNRPSSYVDTQTAPDQRLARPARWSLSSGWGVLAAAAVVAFVLFAMNAWPGASNSGGANRVSNVAAPPADQPPALEHSGTAPQPAHDPTSLVAYRPEYRMQLLDNQGRPAGSDIPLFTEQSAREMGYTIAPSPIPDDLRQHWARSGYRVRQDVDYLTGKLDAGQRFVIPIRTTSVAISQ